MMKVFASTKATSDVVIKSMKKIFSRLKPGSFVFFVGSKKNAKELTTNELLNKFVSCVLGPIKISIADLPVNEDVLKSVSVKPKISGNAYFIVWQKNDSVLSDDVPLKKSKKRKKKKKKKSNIQVEKEFIESTVASKQTGDTSESSETLHSSSSKQSLSDDSYSASSKKIFQPISPIKIQLPDLGKEDHGLTLKEPHSVSRFATILDKIHLDYETGDLTTKDITKSSKESIGVPEIKSQSKKIEKCLAKDVKIKTKSEDISLNEVNSCKQIGVEMAINRVSCEPKSQLIEESNYFSKANINPVLTDCDNKELHLIEVYPHLIEENKTFISNDSNLSDSFNKKESVQDMHFNTIVPNFDNMLKLGANIQVNKNNTAHTVTERDICSASSTKEKTITTANQVTGCLTLDKGVFNASNSNSINNLLGTTLRNDIQNFNYTKSLQDANIKAIEIKNRSRIQENKSIKNSLDHNITVKTPEINVSNKNLHLLLQRCDNLVTSLEKLATNFKNSVSLSSDQDIRCCSRRPCTKYTPCMCKIHHAYVNSYCLNPVYSHCCREVYNCHMFHHNTCTACPQHSCKRAEPN